MCPIFSTLLVCRPSERLRKIQARHGSLRRHRARAEDRDVGVVVKTGVAGREIVVAAPPDGNLLAAIDIPAGSDQTPASPVLRKRAPRPLPRNRGSPPDRPQGSRPSTAYPTPPSHSGGAASFPGRRGRGERQRGRLALHPATLEAAEEQARVRPPAEGIRQRVPDGPPARLVGDVVGSHSGSIV